ncbi:hypothetical protein MHC_02230 [Mycoplasma haemocanis str. Illinois]|uniref:Uncharacterized protein n=1 Tax=Mycoplasma haemocanis (strain Illinois) TaxID=1111676 RepID=H6N6P0_MYCHN|nr:hypothetical protein [Mycoplasma haemocanis]AEW45312.2 hypothetical protein MHC_02230 [Mycoplasma haemocanis str. Illinois]
MAKMIVVGSMLATGTGLGGIGLVVSESGGRRNNTVLKSQRIFSLPKRCDIYSVVSSTEHSGVAKLENESFKNQVDSRHKSNIESACASHGKVYIAKEQGQWQYREKDQKKSWTVKYD